MLEKVSLTLKGLGIRGPHLSAKDKAAVLRNHGGGLDGEKPKRGVHHPGPSKS